MTKEPPRYYKDMYSDEDHLFHYTKRSTSLEHILYKKTLKLNNFIATNDPREYKNRNIGAIGSDWNSEAEIGIEEAKKCSDSILRNHSYFVSFCQNHENDKVIDHGYERARMWSQYGEDHYGVCLVFSKQKLINMILNVVDENKYHVLYESVSYSPTTSLNSLFMNVDKNTFKEISPFKLAVNHIIDYANTLFFEKQKDYADENEFRIIVIPKEENSLTLEGISLNISNCIEAVIVGDRFPEVYQNTMISLCENLGVGLKRLQWENNKFHLTKG